MAQTFINFTTENYAMVICTFEQLKPTHARMAMGGFTPLKISIRTAG